MHATMSVQKAWLVPLSLPKFDGNIQEWKSYFDCFKALVHNDNVYRPAQKFPYLILNIFILIYLPCLVQRWM